MPLPKILRQFDRLDKSSPQFPDELTNLFDGGGYKGWIFWLQDEGASWFIEYLDKVLDTLDSASPAFQRCQRELEWICGTRAKLPKSHVHEDIFSTLDEHPVAYGSAGDIYKGSLNGSKVYVKRLQASDRVLEREGIYRKVIVWKRLTHPNVVPFLGGTLEPLQLISAWVSGEELKEYIVKHPDTDRLSLLTGIADGLNYLHSRNVVHGNLKGPNILVDDSGCPRITEFGLAGLGIGLTEHPLRGRPDEGLNITSPWAAPETLRWNRRRSKEADVFSFAMVMVEAFSGDAPFPQYVPTETMSAALRRPARPIYRNLTDELWVLMESCWDRNPRRRPKMSEVLKTLRGCDPPSDEPQRPLLIDPPQLDLDRFQDPIYSHLDQATESYASLHTSLDKEGASREYISTLHVENNHPHPPLPILPRPTTNCIVNEMLDLTDQFESIAISKSWGVRQLIVTP